MSATIKNAAQKSDNPDIKSDINEVTTAALPSSVLYLNSNDTVQVKELK